MAVTARQWGSKRSATRPPVFAEDAPKLMAMVVRDLFSMHETPSACFPASLVFVEGVIALGLDVDVELRLGYLHQHDDYDMYVRHMVVQVDGQVYDIDTDVFRQMMRVQYITIPQSLFESGMPQFDFVMELPEGTPPEKCFGWPNGNAHHPQWWRVPTREEEIQHIGFYYSKPSQETDATVLLEASRLSAGSGPLRELWWSTFFPDFQQSRQEALKFAQQLKASIKAA